MPEPAARIDARAASAQRQRLSRQSAAAWLHVEVARRMAKRLEVIRVRPRTLIDWNAALGGSFEALAAAYPQSRRIAVEAHPASAPHVGKLPWWSMQRWRRPLFEAAAEAQLPDGAAELLWANMALHAEPDIAAVFARWRRLVAIDGFLMFSTLGPDTLLELRELYREQGWPPPAQDFIDMHDIGDMLMHAGFADPVMDQEHLRLTWSDPAALLRELRTLGGNLHPARTAALRTPRWRDELERRISESAGADGRIALTFEIVYGHAFVPPPRVRKAAAAETIVPLERLRATAKRSGHDEPR